MEGPEEAIPPTEAEAEAEPVPEPEPDPEPEPELEPPGATPWAPPSIDTVAWEPIEVSAELEESHAAGLASVLAKVAEADEKMAANDFTEAAVLYGEALCVVPWKPKIPGAGGHTQAALDQSPGLDSKKKDADKKATDAEMSARAAAEAEVVRLSEDGPDAAEGKELAPGPEPEMELEHAPAPEPAPDPHGDPPDLEGGTRAAESVSGADAGEPLTKLCAAKQHLERLITMLDARKKEVTDCETESQPSIQQGRYNKPCALYARALCVPGATVYLPGIVEDKLRIDGEARIVKTRKEHRKLREKALQAFPDPTGTPYEEAGELYAFLAVNRLEKHYQRVRYLGYHTMKDLVSIGEHDDDHDIIRAKMMEIEGKRLKRALEPVKLALTSNDGRMGDWMNASASQFADGTRIIKRQRAKVAPGASKSAPNRVKPDVSRSVRIVASSVSATRAAGRATNWNQEEAEEIRKLYLSIIQDPAWESAQEDITRMAVGIKEEVAKIERKEKAKKDAEAAGADEAGIAAAIAAAENYEHLVSTADAPAVDPPSITFSIGDELQTFAGETVIVGRREECDVHLKGADQSVSRVQCVICHLGKELDNQIAIIDSWSFMGTRTIERSTEGKPQENSINGARKVLLFDPTECFTLGMGEDNSMRMIFNPKPCIICFTRPRSVRLTCGHGVLCETCWQASCTNRRRSECPVCRQRAYPTTYSHQTSNGPVLPGGTNSYVPPK